VGTPLGSTIKKAVDALLTKRQNDKGFGTYKLLVVTDGEATPPAEDDLLNTLLPDVLSRGIVMDVIGVDMKQDHTLSRNSHRYMRADNPESLKKAVSDSLAEVAQDQGVGNDDFKTIAGIPDDVAAKVVESLAEKVSMNWPIGTPRPTTGTTDVTPVAPVEKPTEELGQGLFFFFGMIAVAFIAFCVLAIVLKGRSY
jgi:hypothetical protein